MIRRALLIFFAVFILLGIKSIEGEETSVAENRTNDATSRVAVVTGSNKGIGFATVKGLCQQFDGIVYLTARDEARGRAAIEKLREIGLQARFHQLDVTDDNSVAAFQRYLNETHGGIDILVNNAGSFPNSDDPIAKQAADTMNVNYFGLLRVSKALFPLLRPHGRVVQVSSRFGHLSFVPGAELRAQLSDPQLTESQLTQIMQCFIDSARNNTYAELGWGHDDSLMNVIYTASKVGVSALTRIQQRAFDADPREDLVVNSVYPGYVKTDLNVGEGVFMPDRGAESSIYAALLPPKTNIKGRYVWHDKSLVDWVNGPIPTED